MNKEVYMYALAGLVIVSTLIIAAIIVFVPIPKDSHDIVMTVLVAQVALCGTIINYYFGSSKGSAEKTEAMLKSSDTPT